MGKVGNSITLFNATVRTLLGVVVVGGLAVGSYVGYSSFNADSGELAAAKAEISDLEKQIDNRDQVIAAKDVEIGEQKEQIEALETSMRYLKFSKQLARVTIKSIYKDPNTNDMETVIDFVELDSVGRPLRTPKEFKVLGDEIYVDALIVKFKDKYIEEGTDPERSSSICMFRRIFGSQQEPENGDLIYEDESTEARHPQAYSQGSVLSPLEQRIWKDFWSIANDADEQNELGIRSNHGTAVSIKPIEGKVYQIRLRAAGGLDLLSDEEMVTPPVTGQAT